MGTDQLNKDLRTQPFAAGAQPSQADNEALEALFGNNMRALNWAARMASYSVAERQAMMGGAAAASAPAAAKGEKKEKKAEKAAEAPKPTPKVVLTKAKAQRAIGGAEGFVDNRPLEEVPNRELEWPAAKIRSAFVDYFKKMEHTYVHSSPSVPTDDPTLLFTNAGMNQFKMIFLGTVDPGSEMATWKRAVNSQKCVRAGGKHNDLDDVGRDTYHHTFFEMLGNWSFGDFGKKEIIEWSFKLMTEVFKLPADQLYATYFEGKADQGLEPDLEAKKEWLKWLPESHILPGDMKDNFWEMGDIGPCGPCSELHYDRVGGRNAAHLVNMDDPLVLELWNLVFMTHSRTEKGLEKLPAQHVDTGLGLERIASVLQGVFSNYDADLWWRMFAKIKEVTGYPHNYHSKECSEDAVVAYRVVADHIRTITMTLSDGGVPDNNGRGYVLRRIIRRAVRYGKEFLGAPLGFFSKLVPAVVEELGDFFPELKAPHNVARLTELIYDEEKSFNDTWELGMKHFRAALANAKKPEAKKANGGKVIISGDDAFTLHDRYGFPVDLTTIMAEKEKCSEPFVDLKRFDVKMEEQRLQSDKGSMKLKQFLSTNNIDALQKQKIPKTDDSSKYTWEKTTGKVLAILDKQAEALVQELGVAKPDPKDKKKQAPKEHMCIITDRTNFYYESGGQIWDTGVIAAKDGSFKVEVAKVLSMGGYIVHIGAVVAGTAKVGAEVELDVDFVRRLDVGANHTGTHELNWCLREVLEIGKGSFVQVNQKGSAVEQDCLRFDFSWNEKVSDEEIQAVEDLLNKSIQQDKIVYTKELEKDQALGISGIRTMFGEKYSDIVRVVSVGADLDKVLADPKNEEWKRYSIEFCGGTHLKSLGDMQKACIVGEESTMKGIRRMTVLSRAAAKKAFEDYEKLVAEHDKIYGEAHTASSIDDKIKAMSVHSKKIGETTVPVVLKRRLQAQMDAEIKTLHSEKKKLVAAVKAEAKAKGEEMGKAADKVIVEAVSTWGADRDALSELSAAIAKENPKLPVFLAASDAQKGKGLALCSVPKEVGKSAKDWIQFACVKGGGTAERAQTGFQPADEAKVLEKAKEWAAKNL